MAFLNPTFKRPCFRVLIPCAIAVLLSVPSAHADEASKRAKVDQLLAMTHMDTMMDRALGDMSKALKSASLHAVSKPDLTPEQQAALDKMNLKVDGILHDSLNLGHVKPAIVQVYMDAYTEEELDGILAFYLSPAGKAFIAKTPQVIQQANQVMRQQMAEVQPKIQTANQEFEAAMAKPAPKK